MNLRKFWASLTFITLINGLISIGAIAAEFTVMRPGALDIPRDIQRIYIDPENINGANDRLNLKQEALERLRDQLNDLGRFKVSIGKPTGIDPNKMTIAVIQGDIISGGEIVDGQMTEKAECVSGLTGLIGAASAKNASQQGITFSRRGMLCKRANIETLAIESGISDILAAAGLEENPRIDEVIRVYKYKNFSLFAQVNLSMTQIGADRETLTIRSDAASFSRHVIDPNSFRNVRESGDNAPLIWLWFKVTPIAPVIIRNIGVVSATDPGSSLGRWYNYVTPSLDDIPAKEREQIARQLIDKAILQFVRTISPHKVKIQTDIARGGNSQARHFIKSGQYAKARQILENAQKHEDLYNLGLTYEAGATSIEDYEDALRLYTRAFDQSPESKLYAAGIGRMESHLRAYERATRQRER